MARAQNRDSVPRVATALGRAGLLPFCAAPLLIYLDPDHQIVYGRALASYALAILCFLVGVWWGLALIRRSTQALVLSNVLVLAAFFGHLLLSTPVFFLLCAVLYPVTIIVERSMHLFRAQPRYYANLRLQLTAVATLTMLLSAALLLAGMTRIPILAV